MKYINQFFTKCNKKGIVLFIFTFLFFVCYSTEVKKQNDSKKEKKFNYSVELYSGAKSNFEEITVGAKIKLPFCDLRTYFTQEKWTFGLSLFSNNFCKTFPVVVKIGKLSPGGIYSKLNSPLLSTSVSPFSSVSETVPYFSCNLPGTTTFEKDLSSFFQIDFVGKKILKKVKLSAFSNLEQEKEFAFGMYSNLLLNKKTNLYFSGIIGNFPYEENNQTSWFLDSAYYPKGNHLCGNFQIGVKLPSIYSTFYIGVYENPFGSFNQLYKLENKFKFQKIILNVSSLFNNSKNLLTSSDKTINETLELKIGMQYLFTKHIKVPVFFKTGINSYLKINLAEETHNAKVGVGVQFNSYITSFSAIANCSCQITTPKGKSFNFDFSSISLQLKNVWYFSKIAFNIGTNLSFSPKTLIDEEEYYFLDYAFLGKVYGKETFSYDMSEKVSFNFTYTQMPFVTFANSLSFWQNDGKYKKSSFDSSINVKYKIKNLLINLKISVNVNF